MHKIVRRLVVADLAMLAVAVLCWLSTWNRDDFSGIIVFYPLAAMTFITVALIVIGFLSALRPAASSTGNGAIQLLWRIPLLLGVPMLGLFYAANGQNRSSLVLVSTVALAIGFLAALLLVVKQLRH